MGGLTIPLAAEKRIVSIVDDELDITVLFHDALCNNMDDVSVLAFNDPVAALEHFTMNKHSYALVISDMRMPVMNGLELLNKIKKINPKVRTILISAYEFQSNSLFEKFMKDGIINSYIEKPIKLNTLCQRVKDELGIYKVGLNYKI